MAGRYKTGGLESDRYRVLRKGTACPEGGHIYERVLGFRFPLNPYNDPHARRAMLRYAASVHNENQDLAHDLLALLRGIESELPADQRVCTPADVCNLTGLKLN